MASEKMLVGRHKRVAFMDADGSGKTFTRMTGFTSLSDGKNSTEYSRQYVDEASERSDVVGYAPAIDYEFDRYTNDPVHEKIAAITDDEILGTEAQVDIVVVDLFEQKTSETTCTARKRTWSVIPDTEGDGTDALIYKGSFKAAGEITKGTATATDGYVQVDGSIGKTQYYKGLDEISAVYENTSTETAELEKSATEKLQDLMNKMTFQMDVAKLGIKVEIGDIVGGRDYLTGMYMSKPVENIIYEITNGEETITYKLEGES